MHNHFSEYHTALRNKFGSLNDFILYLIVILPVSTFLENGSCYTLCHHRMHACLSGQNEDSKRFHVSTKGSKLSKYLFNAIKT